MKIFQELKDKKLFIIYPIIGLIVACLITYLVSCIVNLFTYSYSEDPFTGMTTIVATQPPISEIIIRITEILIGIFLWFYGIYLAQKNYYKKFPKNIKRRLIIGR